MTIAELWNSIAGMNWQTFITIILVNWYFYHRVKEDMKAIHNKMTLLDDRMFQLATGKTLADAIKEDRKKELGV